MMMTDDELRELGDKWERWARYSDPSAFTPDDAEALLGEVRDMRVQQVRLIALVRQARDRLTEVNASYRELLGLPGVQAIVLAHQAEAERSRPGPRRPASRPARPGHRPQPGPAHPGRF